MLRRKLNSPSTEEAVKEARRQLGLTETGKVSPAARKRIVIRLNEILANREPTAATGAPE